MPASYLKIGGELAHDAILRLVEVTQEINRHWWCRVEFRQTEDRRVAVEDLLGQDMQIVTRDQAGAEHVLFDGFILESSLVYEVFGSYTARLTAVTRSYQLELSAQESYYRKQTLSAVAQAVCGARGLTAELLAKDGLERNYVQCGEPDFRFLIRIADDHQAWIRPTAAGIRICDSFQRGAGVNWRQEDGLLSFDVEGILTAPSFEGTHADARAMRSVTQRDVRKAAAGYGSSGPMVAAADRQSSAKLPPGAVLLDGRAATSDEYRSALERESLRAASNRVIGHGVSQKEDLAAGDTVQIDGVLDAKGTYGLTKVVHRWTRTGYENEFWCVPAATWLPPDRPSAPAMAGVVTARVVEHNDPRKMGRIQVQYDWQENGPTAWVRATTPHAGQDRGFHFLPETGDEVVVAFEHGDPERPYVVGSLWNGVDQAPREEFWGADVDPNDVKRIVTKSGHRIQLVDRPGKESIVLATPQNLKISLIEKADETGRSMILLHSEGDVFVNAPGGRVHLHGAAVSQEVGAQAKSAAPRTAGEPPPRSPQIRADSKAENATTPATLLTVGSSSSGSGRIANTVDDATDDQARMIGAAHTTALEMMDAAVKRLESAKKKPDPVVRQYFDIDGTGKADQKRLDKLIANYRKMKSGMAEAEYEVENEPIKPGEPNTIAYVYKLPLVHGVGHVHVCFPMFEKLAPERRANTLVHEMSHYAVGTEDHAYDWQDKWNTLTQSEKMDNASTYGDFAEVAAQ